MWPYSSLRHSTGLPRPNTPQWAIIIYLEFLKILEAPAGLFNHRTAGSKAKRLLYNFYG